MNTLPFVGSKVIAGEKGLNRPVALFGMLDAPDSIDLVKPNEFIITTGFSIREDSSVQLDVIRRLHERNAAGLGVKMNRYIDEFSREILDFANKCRFPIISLPNLSTFYDLSSSIFFMNANLSEKYADVLTRFRYMLTTATSNEDIVNFLSLLIHCPCTIYFDRTLVSSVGKVPALQQTESIIASSASGGDRALDEAHRVGITRVRCEGPETALVCPLQMERGAKYYIVVWEGKSQLSESLLLLNFAIMLIWWKLMEMGHEENDLNQERSAFFRQLLTTQLSADTMAARVERTKLSLSGRYVVLLVRYRTRSGVLSDADAELPLVLIKTLQRLGNQLGYPHCQVLKDSFCFLVSLLTEDCSEDATRAHLEEIIARMRRDVESEHRGAAIAISAGAFAGSLHEVMRSYQAALIAKAVVERPPAVRSLGDQGKDAGAGSRRGDGDFFDRFYMDAAIYRLLFDNIGEEERVVYVKRYIAPLLSAKDQANSDLLTTLIVYLRSNRSNRKCAKEMYLHENTIIYRMNKIKKLCNLDFNKADDFLLLETAVKLYKISLILADGV